MSDIKFLAAKELIQEQRYDEAPGILKTIKHPTAKKWLRRIDELDPPFPETPSRRKSERDKYYERENRRAKRRSNGFGVELVLQGIGVLAVWLLLSGFFFGKPLSEAFSGTSVILLGLGCVILVVGFVQIIRPKS